MVNVKQVIRLIIYFLIIYISLKIKTFNEPIILYYLYLFLYKKRYSTLFYSSLGFLLVMDKNLFLKNIIMFLLFEIFNSIFSNNKNKIVEYYVFLLTFFIYLVLINIFEPMIYNLSRVINSIFIYIATLIIWRLDLKFSKNKEVY